MQEFSVAKCFSGPLISTSIGSPLTINALALTRFKRKKIFIVKIRQKFSRITNSNVQKLIDEIKNCYDINPADDL